MKSPSDIEPFLGSAMAAVLHAPFEFSCDIVSAPTSSKEHFAKSIANISTAAANAVRALVEDHPSRAGLIRAAVCDILANSVLDERMFTVTAESLDKQPTQAEVKRNLSMLESVLRTQCEIVLRACDMAEKKLKIEQGGEAA